MKEVSKLKYRLMKTGEEKHAYKLVRRVFHKHVAPTYSKKGIKTFLSMLSVEFFKEASNEKFTIVTEYQNQLVGILAFININHIALLFVDSKFQGKGVGNGGIE